MSVGMDARLKTLLTFVVAKDHQSVQVNSDRRLLEQGVERRLKRFWLWMLIMHKCVLSFCWDLDRL
jgi:hypothetical protein